VCPLFGSLALWFLILAIGFCHLPLGRCFVVLGLLFLLLVLSSFVAFGAYLQKRLSNILIPLHFFHVSSGFLILLWLLYA
jgi:hypothetical protein